MKYLKLNTAVMTEHSRQKAVSTAPWPTVLCSGVIGTESQKEQKKSPKSSATHLKGSNCLESQNNTAKINSNPGENTKNYLAG